MPTIVMIAYIPVLHEGYRRFIAAHPEAATLYVLAPDVIAEFPHLAKEIRALAPELVVQSIQSWHLAKNVELLSKEKLSELAATPNLSIVAPQEDVLQELVARSFPQAPVAWQRIFLRWDKHQSTATPPVSADSTILDDEFAQRMMKLAYTEASKSADWWRHVGGVVSKDGVVLGVAHNAHLPTDHQLYIDGDPRNNFHKGDHLELSTAIHAEAKLVADAAKKGQSLKGCDMYVTTFPCPPCAKLVAACGVKRLYFSEGYGVLDGEAVLKDAGVEITRIDRTA